MPNLRCSAESCMHNCEDLCCRNDINVAGQGASTSNETCCSNFCEGSSGASNAVEAGASPETDVACEAQNCTHNNGCKCHAASIDVSGYGANVSNDTACSSFCPS